MRNYKLLRVDSLTGETVLLAENLSEAVSARRAHKLEKREIRKPRREYWYASGNITDWKDFGKKFLKYHAGKWNTV